MRVQPSIRYNNGFLLVDQEPLLVEYTYLTADIAASSGTLTVANIDHFAINQNLIINPWGENAEFVKTHTATSPTGSTITLVANTTFAHYTGEPVYLVLYNQIEFSHTTTATGTKTTLTTSTGNGLYALEADNKILAYEEKQYDSGYYFARYVNNIGATFTVAGDTFTSAAHGLVNGDTIKVIGATTLAAGLSTTIVYYVISSAANTFKVSLTNGGTAITTTDGGTGSQTWYKCSLYSDALIYSGWGSNTVGYLIDRSLSDLETTLSEKITLTDCLEWINEGIKLIQGKLKRWPEHYSYNAVLGQASSGTNVIAMPTDAYDTETNKSLLAVRIGDNKKLTYLDPVSFENLMEGVKTTQVTTQAAIGATTLYIDNSYDFKDTGTAHVYISGTRYDVAYTGVTRSSTAGALTGASGITAIIPADTYIWQDEEEGIPTHFTVRNSNIEFYPLVDASEDNANIYSDYSKVATSVDSEGDAIDFQRFDMLQSYLTWRIKMKSRNNGNLDLQDGYYFQFKEKLNDAIRTLPQNNLFKMKPKINHMQKRGVNIMQDIPIDDQ